nr:unnamed protein product [Callosobruchus analis]
MSKLQKSAVQRKKLHLGKTDHQSCIPLS